MSLKEIAVTIQKEIARLTGERSKLVSGIDAEIARLAGALKALEITGKAATVLASSPPKKRVVMQQASKAAPTKKAALTENQEIALGLLKRGRVSPTDLAEKAGIGNEYASQVLTRLVKDKLATKEGRGVYVLRASGK